MNTPNPLVPQGTFAGKSHFRFTFFAILAVHVVLLGVLLIAGCDKKGTENAANDPGLPPAGLQPPPDPNWPGPANPPMTGVANVAPVPVNTNPLPTTIVEPPPPPPPPPPPAYTEHTVVKGDSFYTLGKKYNVGYQTIANENPGVDSTKLKIGQKIKIPPPKSANGAGSGLTAGLAGDAGEKTYTVKSGDNLTKIARANGTTIRELRSANNLRTDQLKVGQKLKIPGKAQPPLEATSPPPVLPPETLPPSGAP